MLVFVSERAALQRRCSSFFCPEEGPGVAGVQVNVLRWGEFAALVSKLWFGAVRFPWDSVVVVVLRSRSQLIFHARTFTH